jgi:O-antigen/teichoic acid export membrane protein
VGREHIGGTGDSASLDVTLEQPDALPESDFEPLQSPDVGLRVIRGATLRGGGYALGMLLTATASIFLLRHLGVADFGRYMTVTSLVAIVGGLTDAGLTAVGGRDLALRPPGPERGRLLANLLGLRLLLTPLGVLVAIAFAIVAGYDHTLVVGTLLAGAGLVLVSCQATMTLPLSVGLRIGRLTATEVIKQAAMLLGIVVLVAAGAGLSPFFAVSVAVGLVTLAVTPTLVGRDFVWRPAFDRAEWRTLIREALPLAAAVVVGVLYFRLLILLMSLLSTDVATGLFATSFRVTEILYGIATLAVTVALPVLAVAAEERARLSYMLQRMIEVSVIAACYLIVVVVIVAEPVLRLLGGGQYRAAAPVLRIQVFALLPVFLAQVCVVGLISIRRSSIQAAANAFAVPIMLGLGLVLIPRYQATGAAVAALVAETGYFLALLVLLVRSDPSMRPSFRFLWKVAVACGLAAAATFVPGLPTLVTAVAATLFYIVGLCMSRAIPREVFDAFTPRKRR